MFRTEQMMTASQHSCLLRDRVILIVQLRWVIARQLTVAFEAEGAHVLLARDAITGAPSAETPGLAGAVLDSRSDALCRSLEQKGLPFVLYTARAYADGDGANPIVKKPAGPQEVVEAMRRLL